MSPWLILAARWPIGFVVVWAIWNLLRDGSDEKEVVKNLAWPETQGTVTATEVMWAHVEVAYKYSVASTEYTGKFEISLPPQVPDRNGLGAARLNASAHLEMADYPPGSGLVIRYNPNNHSESVLFCRVADGHDKTESKQPTPTLTTFV